MNELAIALYITAGCHTALLLMIMPIERPPWYLTLSAVLLWPMLVPTILLIAAIDCLRLRWSWRKRKPVEFNRWVPLVMMAALASPMSATEWGVDEGWDWHDSNHHEHALGGAALGAAGYALASLGTPSRPWRYAWAVGGTAAAATAYELAMAQQDGNLADYADIAWTTVGGLAGAVIADLTGQAITLVITPDVVAGGLAWRW